MNRLKTLICLTAIIACLTCCKKENNTKVKPLPQTFNAMVIDSGDIAADGCGWLIKIDSIEYHADNLPSGFQKNGLNVNVKYEVSNSGFQCGMNPDTRLPVIHITSISN